MRLMSHGGGGKKPQEEMHDPCVMYPTSKEEEGADRVMVKVFTNFHQALTLLQAPHTRPPPLEGSAHHRWKVAI